jgi:hypothetical protein
VKYGRFTKRRVAVTVGCGAHIEFSIGDYDRMQILVIDSKSGGPAGTHV